jgi:hypothetical protein
MVNFKRAINFYIRSSIHVALSVYALVHMTHYVFHIQNDGIMAWFAFFGTVVGYNFVKYDALARAKKNNMRSELKVIAVFSLCSLLASAYYFIHLQLITQMVSVGVLGLTLLYTLPFFPNRRNARNWAGVKIYIVSLCWVGVTVVLPVLNAGIALETGFYIVSIQRFILIFVLILIFEIIDLTQDDPHLQTVPQQIGVKQTKILGFVLLILFCGLELFNSNVNFQSLPLLLTFALVIITALFLAFANEKRTKYYTSFWVESVPILWWLMVVFI